MRLLIFSRGYPSKKYPMNGIFEFDQAMALHKAGVNLVYLTIDLRSIRRWRKWGFESFKKNGVKVLCLNVPLGRIPKPAFKLMRFIAVKLAYKKLVRMHGKPDIIHSHFLEISNSIVKLAKKENVKLVLTEHLACLTLPDAMKKYKVLVDKTYSKADKILTVSPALQKILKDSFGYNSLYVPNVINTEAFKFIEREKKNSFEFITVGSLIQRKQIDLVVKVFAKHISNFNGARLTIIGEGEDRKIIEKIITEYKVKEKVKLCGLQSREFIAKAMQKAHCFVLPSRAETFGVVYVEAMATGLPVIATKCNGPEHFINETNGLLIEVDDENALKKAMIYMYNNAHNYNAKAIAANIQKEFSEEALVKRLKNTYNEVIMKNNTSFERKMRE